MYYDVYIPMLYGVWCLIAKDGYGFSAIVYSIALLIWKNFFSILCCAQSSVFALFVTESFYKFGNIKYNYRSLYNFL